MIPKSFTATIHAGLVHFAGAAYLPSLARAVESVRDADAHLLGCWPQGECIASAMAAHRDALVAMRRVLSPLKVI
jgi:hypothetical protein